MTAHRPISVILLSLSTSLGTALGQVESYIPLVTEPGWVQTMVDNSFFDGSVVQSESRNLLGIDSENRIVLPIINGFRGGSPIETVSDSDGGEFDDPFSTLGRNDYSVGETGITYWHSTAASLNGGSGQGAAGVTLDSFTTYTGLGPSDTPTDGVLLFRRKATIGEITAVRYQQSTESTSQSEGLNLRTVDNQTVDRRDVYAGTDTVDGLFPGSSPVLVTGPYEALVRVSETTISGVSETFVVDEGVETSFGVTETGPTSITTIEWTVKGIGLVRMVLIFGEWLDDIVQNSLFDNGSNVVGATSLEQLISQDNWVSEILRASGGNLNDAADTILTTTGQEIILYPTPPERVVVTPPSSPSELITQVASEAGLSGNDLLPEAIPQKDGVPNLLKLAFNLDFSRPDSHVWIPDSNSGLPSPQVRTEELLTLFEIKFLRRKNAGLTYTPVYSTNLAPESFTTFPGTEIITSIDSEFELVCVSTPIDLNLSTHYFGKVEVTY